MNHLPPTPEQRARDTAFIKSIHERDKLADRLIVISRQRINNELSAQDWRTEVEQLVARIKELDEEWLPKPTDNV